jgi:hypothetical protein
MRNLPIEIIILSGLSLLTFASVADAAGPAQADFDSCNKEAYNRAASPSAAPAPGGDVPKSGTPVSPSAAPTTGAPSTPSTSAPAGADRATRPGTPVAPSAEPRTSAPSVSTPDDRSRGMAAAGQADPAFRRAYVECMKRRGF